MVIWVAAGGRGTLVGAALGAIGVNWIQSWLTTSYPDLWLLFLGTLFMSVVLLCPDGAMGALRRGLWWSGRRWSAARTGVAVASAPPSRGVAG
jgi:urea transport system permease protein